MRLRRTRKDDVDVQSCLANLERLAALEELSPAWPSSRGALDNLARSAASLLNTPMAFMSILDAHIALFAGAFGIAGDLAETRQNSAEDSYCQYVVAFDDVLVVENSSSDPLVAAHPATTQDGVRAYLGVPLRHRGQCLGSFCVVDTQPRQWTDQDLGMLQELADRALAQIR